MVPARIFLRRDCPYVGDTQTHTTGDSRRSGWRHSMMEGVGCRPLEAKVRVGPPRDPPNAGPRYGAIRAKAALLIAPGLEDEPVVALHRPLTERRARCRGSSPRGLEASAGGRPRREVGDVPCPRDAVVIPDGEAAAAVLAAIRQDDRVREGASPALKADPRVLAGRALLGRGALPLDAGDEAPGKEGAAAKAFIALAN